MFWLYTLVLVLSTFGCTVAALLLARRILTDISLSDIPNERSNHAVPVPRGAGIAVVIALGCFLLVAGTQGLVLWAMIGVAIISFADDLHGVPVPYRLAVHLAAALLAVMALHGPVLGGVLPLWLDHLAVALILVFWMNLYNFMDGIDGITGAQTASLGFGLILLSATTPIIAGIGVDGLLLVTASLAFLLFNWHPAKMFLGDVGSVPLGLLTGFYLIEVAANGYWEAALILPAYYLADGGVTIARRLYNREKIWQAHSQHAYQIAVRAGNSHDEVVRWILAGNTGLLALAMLATREGCGLTALILAVILAGALRWKLTVLKPQARVEILPPQAATT